MDLIILIAVLAWVSARAVERGSQERRKSREGRLGEISKRMPGGVPKSRKLRASATHDAGWWGGEVLHGFPVHRRGWHAGWLAHQVEAVRQDAIREEARTTHLETRQSFAEKVREHRERQARAQEAIDAYTAVHGEPEGKAGREAVREAVLADVVPIRPRDRAIPDEIWHDHGPGAGDRRISEPVPSAWVPVSQTAFVPRQFAPEPGPYVAKDSAWLEPGDRRCGTCGGSGALGEGTCPVCRGWGSAPADPGAPEAEPGAICAACGRPGTEDDPVLRDGRHLIHRSHAIEGTRRAHEAEKALAAPVTELADFRGGQPAPEMNGGTNVPTGVQTETTYGQTHADLSGMITEAEMELARLRVRQIGALVEKVAAAGVGGDTLSHLADVDDGIQAEIKAAQQQLDSAQAAKDALVRDHGAGHEYHSTAAGGGAEKTFLQE